MPESTKPPAGLWRNNPETPEGKYLVIRRDGTIVEWANFVIGAKDAAAPAGLRGYADEAERLGYNAQYVGDIRRMADDWELDPRCGTGDPDRGPHRKDDPDTIAQMKNGGSV